MIKQLMSKMIYGSTSRLANEATLFEQVMLSINCAFEIMGMYLYILGILIVKRYKGKIGILDCIIYTQNTSRRG